MPASKFHIPSLSRIDAAAQILFDARRASCGRLDEHCRPKSLTEAQAIQHAVLQKTHEQVGGWKVGRIGGMIYSALLPASTIVSAGVEIIALPRGAKIELELATRFHTRLSWQDIARMQLNDVPAVAECIALFEFVCSRFRQDADQDALEKIADNVSTTKIVTGSSMMDWPLQCLLNTHAVLRENGSMVVRHDGAHLSEPLLELFSAWRNRCVQEQLTVEPGQLITWGSLSGVRPVPSIGADYVGWVGDALSVRCIAVADNAPGS